MPRVTSSDEDGSTEPRILDLERRSNKVASFCGEDAWNLASCRFILRKTLNARQDHGLAVLILCRKLVELLGLSLSVAALCVLVVLL